jgi:polysaccharide pyruvyl transferase WcaK-like protein
VRSEPCRRALLDLGVEEERIRVGADWAWAYRPRRDRQEWADATWRGLGVHKDRPLLVVNVVNEIWRDREEVKNALADALDALAADGFQVAFFCNEAREGEFYDRAAADAVAGRMKSHAIVVPNLYYGPDEVLALLKPAAATVATRYHFIVESILAGTVPVPITRSAKTEILARELLLTPGGTLDGIDAGALAEAVRAAVRDRATSRPRLAAAAGSLAERTRDNLTFWNRAQG